MLTLAAFDIAQLFTTENLVALVTLTLLEIVLGIDNIVFIAILCAKLPPHQRETARKVGLTLALVTRIALLATLSWIIGLAKTTLFTIPQFKEMQLDEATKQMVEVPLGISGRDLILIIGGLFLIFKATKEIHHKLEGGSDGLGQAKHAAFWPIIAQILVIDLVFSLDSVITAVGMARALWVMVTAVVLSVIVMLLASGKISNFINHHPTMKMLALAFLLLIGVVLVADGLGQHISKGYIYFAMAFSLGVEMLNLVSRKKAAVPPVPAT